MASGDSLAFFYPAGNEPPASNAAVIDTRNGHPVLDFPDGSTGDTAAVWTFIVPRHYGGSGITAYVHYTMSSAESGTVVWEGSFEYIGTAQDIDSDSFAAVQYVQDTVPATSGIPKAPTITFTDGAQIDSLAVGGLARFKLGRDANDTNATDNAVGDAEVLSVELKET